MVSRGRECLENGHFTSPMSYPSSTKGTERCLKAAARSQQCGVRCKVNCLAGGAWEGRFWADVLLWDPDHWTSPGGGCYLPLYVRAASSQIVLGADFHGEEGWGKATYANPEVQCSSVGKAHATSPGTPLVGWQA